MQIKLIALGLLLSATASLPARQAPSPRPAFDTVSIRPGDPAGRPGQSSLEPTGRFTVENTLVRQLIQNAYGVDAPRLSGGPGWIDSTRYTITAIPPPNLPPLPREANRARWQLMVQALLAERFKLAVHSETREMNVYELVIARGGSKFPPAAPVPPGKLPPVVGLSDPKNPAQLPPRVADDNTTAAIITGIPGLVTVLGRQLGRPVIDKTGIEGAYLIHLVWIPQLDPASDSGRSGSAGPSIFTALEEQLGLHLRTARAPVEIVVIDRIERPTAN